jgi:hypothetical protein
MPTRALKQAETARKWRFLHGGASAAETAGDDVEEEANVYTKALATDAATTPEV